jgi:hypothetical protein
MMGPLCHECTEELTRAIRAIMKEVLQTHDEPTEEDVRSHPRIRRVMEELGADASLVAILERLAELNT